MTEQEIPWVYFKDEKPEEGQWIVYTSDRDQGFARYSKKCYWPNEQLWAAIYFKPQKP